MTTVETAHIMDSEPKSYEVFDGMQFVHKRANSRTPRKASHLAKVAKRRKERKAARRKRRGS